MNAIAAYLDALKCQAGLLDYANQMDDVCWRETRNGPAHRHWTRQDGNRFNLDVLQEDIAHENLSFNEWEERQATVPRLRCSTRVSRLLPRCRKAIEQQHLDALAEAERRGLYSSLAPLLVGCIEAHRKLLDSYSADDTEYVPAGRYRRIDERHREAMGALEDHLPPATNIKRIAADGKTDTKGKIFPGMPENPKVPQLAKRIRNNLDKQRTKIDIAREFTGSNEKEAQSLLRKLRDYPHLLNGADGADT